MAGESEKQMGPPDDGGQAHSAADNSAAANLSTTLPNRLVDRIEHVPVAHLTAYRRNARRHPKKQLLKLEKSIRTFGFVIPVTVDGDNEVVCGHARLQVAKHLGMVEVPVIRLTHLTRSEIKALRIADNRLTELAEWDSELLAVELQHLVDVDFDVEITGFEVPEIDSLISDQLQPVGLSPADAIPDLNNELPAVSQAGDLWLLDEHRLLCGSALEEDAYTRLMDEQTAQMVITDPPYNVPIHGHVCGKGATRHREFVMASGEMSDSEYSDFLEGFVRNLIRFSTSGSVHFICIDWRHLGVLQNVCRRHYAEQLNLCVWAKTNGGMGSLYRSQHELVVVFKNGQAPHINNVQLGRFGRNRTNVWVYEGVNTLNPDRRGDLALHPTVKPVALIADAIRDCSKRRGLVLDPFAGSGTALIACEETGRICRAMELDPQYVDVAVRRWQAFTGGQARHETTDLTFDDLAHIRSCGRPLLPPPSNQHGEGS